MSVHISAQVWDLDLPSTHKLILLKLADCANADGSNAWPSVARIAHECCVNERTVRRALTELVANGVLEVEKAASQHRPTVYKVIPTRADKLSPLVFPDRTLSQSRPDIVSPDRTLTTSRPDRTPPDPSYNRPNDPSSDDPSGERGLKPVAVREMIGTLEGWLGPLAWDANVHDEIEWFAEEFAGQVVTVNAARKKCAELNLGRPFPYNLKKAMAAMKEPTTVEREFGNAPPKTATDYALRLKAEEIQRNDRAAKANTDEAIIAWDVALTQARKELA